MFTGGDDVGAIVADIGSYASRIGYAGDDLPRAYFPTALGVTQAEGGDRKTEFEIANFRENMSLECPIRNGQIVDWDLLEKIWEHSMNRYMKVDIKESPVLIAEKPYNPPAARQQMTELMFETFNAPAVFIAKDAVLECYACGRTTGLVIDVGASGTVVSPVCDGYVDMRGLNRSIIGGRLMDSYAVSVIKKQANRISSSTASLPHFRVIKSVGQDRSIIASPSGVCNVHPTYDAFMNLEMGRDLKEAVCRVAESTLIDTDPRFANLPMTLHELPDGTVVDMGIERFQICEMLFDPSSADGECVNMSLMGFSSPHSVSTTDGIARLISNSVLKCDNEVQANLLQNLVVAGGGSSTEGMPERIKLEVESLVHVSAPGLRIKSMALGSSERALTCFLGGSILASLGSFHEMWMSRQEYDEFGPGLVDKKCP